MVYSAIEDKAGRAAAVAYADANTAGFAEILRLAGTDCMLERGLEHVVYAEDETGAAALAKEAQVVADLGLPATTTTRAPVRSRSRPRCPTPTRPSSIPGTTSPPWPAPWSVRVAR